MNSRPAISFVQGLLAFAGASVALFVYVEKTRTGEVPCIAGYTGCTAVTTGPYSHIGPIDLSLLGAAAYVVILLLSVVKGTSNEGPIAVRIRQALLGITLIGFCYSWYLQWLAKFVIKDFCIYCRTSAVIMTVLFILSILETILAARNEKSAENPAAPGSSMKTI